MDCKHEDTYLTGTGQRRCFDCRADLPDAAPIVQPVAVIQEPVARPITVISPQSSPTLLNTVTQGNCLDLLPRVASGSVDMVLCDLPYGTTACKWDIIIPFDKLWAQYKRVLRSNCAIVLTAREPFTSALVMSNVRQYKHKWVWNKKQSGSFQNAKYMPLQIEEDILVFCDGRVQYFPTMRSEEHTSELQSPMY